MSKRYEKEVIKALNDLFDAAEELAPKTEEWTGSTHEGMVILNTPKGEYIFLPDDAFNIAALLNRLGAEASA